MQYIIANNVNHNEHTLSKLPVNPDDTIIVFNCYLLNKLPKWDCHIIWMPRDIKKFGVTRLKEMADYLKPEMTYICYDKNNDAMPGIADQLGIDYEIKKAEIGNSHFIPSTGFLAAKMFPDAVCVGFDHVPGYDNNNYHNYSYEHRYIKNNRKNILL